VADVPSGPSLDSTPHYAKQIEIPALSVMSRNGSGNDSSVPDTSVTAVETFSSSVDEDAAVAGTQSVDLHREHQNRS
jgi:hypothetical protein